MQTLLTPRYWSPVGWRDDLLGAARLLTRLPLGPARPASATAATHSSRCYPLVGAVIGAISAVAFGLALWLALPPFAAALAALVASLLVSGALHEDGLADVADGLGGGHDRESKLAIMRDSRIGSYGVLALILAMAARGGSLTVLAAPWTVAAALVAAHALSRAGLAVIMRALPLARPDGLATATGRPGDADAAVAALLGLAIALALLGPGVALVAVLAVATLQAGLALQARRQVGGITGDVLGAAQQLGEVAVLLVACAGAAA